MPKKICCYLGSVAAICIISILFHALNLTLPAMRSMCLPFGRVFFIIEVFLKAEIFVAALKYVINWK